METINKKTPVLTPQPGATTITTDTVRCWIDESDIAIFLAEGNQTLENAKENMEAYRHLSNGKRTPVLLDFSNIKAVSREAREYYGSEENSSMCLAIAIITTSVVGNLIGNFFLGFNKNKVGAPTKLFTNAKDAKKWLLQFVDPSM